MRRSKLLDRSIAPMVSLFLSTKGKKKEKEKEEIVDESTNYSIISLFKWPKEGRRRDSKKKEIPWNREFDDSTIYPFFKLSSTIRSGEALIASGDDGESNNNSCCLIEQRILCLSEILYRTSFLVVIHKKKERGSFYFSHRRRQYFSHFLYLEFDISRIITRLLFWYLLFRHRRKLNIKRGQS